MISPLMPGGSASRSSRVGILRAAVMTSTLASSSSSFEMAYPSDAALDILVELRDGLFERRCAEQSSSSFEVASERCSAEPSLRRAATAGLTSSSFEMAYPSDAALDILVELRDGLF